MAGYSVTYTVVDNATKQIDAINRRIQQLRAPMDKLAKSSKEFIDVSGLGKIADGFKGVASAAGDVVSSLTRIVPILGTIAGAASIAGMAKLVSQFTEWGAALRRDSDSLNITSQRLQSFQNAARLAGGSADDMTESLKDLQKATADALLGRDPIAAQTFARAGIALRKANGEMRESVEILPEAMAYIDKFSNAQDRMQIATQLGSRRLYELYQAFRIAGRPMSEFIKEAEELGLITARDQKAMQEYRNSVTKLSIAFENLGYVLGGTVAEALQPLVKDFTEWVRQHGPEITATIRQIGQDFKTWYEKGGWEDLKATLSTIWNVLKFVGQHAEAIAITFAVGWGIKAVAGVAQLTAALGYAGAGLAGAGGVGLLGALGVGAALLASMAVAWKLLHEGRGLPGTATDPKNPNRFGDPSIPAMPGGAGAPAGGGFRGPGEAPIPGGPAAPGADYTPGRGHGMTMRNAGAGAGGVSLAQMKQLALDAGFSAEEAPIMAATLMHESSGNPNAKGKAGELGIAQVHPAAWGQDLANQSMGNPKRSMEIARMIYLKQGFNAWSSYKHGHYRQYLDAAKAAKPEPYNPNAGGGGRSAEGVNADLVSSMQEGFKRALPPGYTARLSSGLRPGDPGAHGQGMATDWQIYDPKGNPIPNEGGDTTGLYRRGVVEGGAILRNKNPELFKTFAWGEHFGTQKGGGGPPDTMHVDAGFLGPRGHFGDPWAERADIEKRAAELRAQKAPAVTPPQAFAPRPAAAAGGMPDIRNIGPPDGPRGMAYIFGNKIPRPKLDAKGKILAYPPQTDATGNVIGPNTYTPAGAQGPRSELNGGGRGANGEVNVTVTHKNPPPGAQMRATGKGDGMNIAPVRTEYQDLAVV